jgi:hypothetical protein
VEPNLSDKSFTLRQRHRKRLEGSDMGKTRHWLLIALGSLGIAVCSPLPASAETFAGGEQNWSRTTFSSLLEASGPPEFGRCIKVMGGIYEDAGCTTVGSLSGKSYEWYAAFESEHPLEKTGFTTVIKESTVAELETVSANLVTCTGESGVGKYTGNKTIGGLNITFTGCSGFGSACTSAGSASGTIVTTTLEGVLGVEELGAEPALNKIGEDVFPAGHSGPIGEFTCGGLPMLLAGAVISPVQSNSMKLTSTIKAKALKGKQKPEQFVEGANEVLKATINNGSPEQAGESLTTNQTNEEKVEINSVL